MTHKQVVNQIVENDLCIGCGVCAGVCPSKLLTMDWVANGDLAVSIEGECPPSCSLCLDVCPFVDGNPNEDQITEIKFDTQVLNSDKDLGIHNCPCQPNTKYSNL